MALLSVIMNKFDTAKYYLEKFRDRFFKIWSGVKDFSSLQPKTEVICDFLRQHEPKEFLSNTRHFNVEGMVDSPDLENFCQTLDRWLKIDSSATLENFNYLSDSYHSRNLFTEIMKHRYREEYSEDRYNRHRVKIALDYASGLLKMGHVDIAERTLSQICSVQ